MKNKLIDLNNHLFAQLERLSDETMDMDAIEREIRRTEAIVDVSEQIVRTANTSIKAATLIAEHGDGVYLSALPVTASEIKTAPKAIAKPKDDGGYNGQTY